LAQLAMHSSVETAGCADTQALVDAMTALYSTALCADDDGALYWA